MRHQIAFAGPVTQVDTEALYSLGEIRDELSDSYGWQTWVYVFNDEAASAFAVGTIVAHDTATIGKGDGIIAPVDSPAVRVIGVAQHAIAAGSYGWILKEGLGSVLADTGGFTADNGLIVGDTVAGRADNVASAVNATFAYAHESALATATGLCSIKC